MGFCNLSFNAERYGSGSGGNFFTLEGISTSPDTAEQIGDVILALEDRLNTISESSDRDTFTRSKLRIELLELAADYDWPALIVPGLRKGGVQYNRFSQLASIELLRTALSALHGYVEAVKDKAIEAQDEVRETPLGTLEDGVRPMSATV